MMKKRMIALLVCVAMLSGCAPGAKHSHGQTSQEPSPSITPAQATPASVTPAPSASAAPVSPVSPAELPERTPNPASEMLVTGTVTELLNNAIEVKADNLQKDLVITMLNRADYADGVSKVFKVGNNVRIITSNKLAKTLPEKVAAKTVLVNNK